MLTKYYMRRKIQPLLPCLLYLCKDTSSLAVRSTIAGVHGLGNGFSLGTEFLSGFYFEAAQNQKTHRIRASFSRSGAQNHLFYPAFGAS
jgi:hypothetical protein